jgi:hypothetical protein
MALAPFTGDTFPHLCLDGLVVIRAGLLCDAYRVYELVKPVLFTALLAYQ